MGSQVGDTRPLSSCHFSPNSEFLATGSFTGNVKVWKVPELEEVHKIAAHELNIGCVAWHPGALVSIGEDECCLATCSANGEVHHSFFVKLFDFSVQKSQKSANFSLGPG